MSAIEIVVELLTSDADLADLLPESSHYPFSAPQGASDPYTVINRAGSSDSLHLSGGNNYSLERIMIEIVGSTGGVVEAIGSRIKTILHTNIKITAAGCKDVDTYFGDIDTTQTSDARDAFKRTMHFFVRWRS